MIYQDPMPQQSSRRQAITADYSKDEVEIVNDLITEAAISENENKKIKTLAEEFTLGLREERLGKSGLGNFLNIFQLNSEEGVALMCLAEALLRIPDKANRDQLIEDKISKAKWQSQREEKPSLIMNAATWALMLTGKIMESGDKNRYELRGSLKRLLHHSGAPLVRQSMNNAMKILGRNFIAGETIEQALRNAKDELKQGYYHSYDMLGEAARTAEHAQNYFSAYKHAIEYLAKVANRNHPYNNPGISIKLSALYPRYEFSKRANVHNSIIPQVKALAQLAKAAKIGLTIDAEEANRLDLSLDIFDAVFSDSSMQGWDGFGIAVQSYQKRISSVLDWLLELAKQYHRPIMIRLIKGAYWDSEIKDSQIQGFNDYPVFTRKSNTDIAYVAAIKRLLAGRDIIFPQFATHNARTLATVLVLAGDERNYEFQCLHGMGHPLYDQVVGSQQYNIPCRIYAPVGAYKDLLPYLVRRLLENGANNSFVNQIANTKTSIEELIEDPVAITESLDSIRHPLIPLPRNIYGDNRLNSLGIDLTNIKTLEQLQTDLLLAQKKSWIATPLIANLQVEKNPQAVFDPSHNSHIVGYVTTANSQQVEHALENAKKAYGHWNKTPLTERSNILKKAADLLEKNYSNFMYLSIREAGRTIVDALSEVREAVDFCRYYAHMGCETLKTTELVGPTGEHNELQYHGRGPVACISPWNFPIAIFMGQVTAALMAGNPVLAKPAEQTPLIAMQAVRLLHEAGVPENVLQLLPGAGETVGAQLVADDRIKAVIFTGSTDTARFINQSLASRSGEIIPFIAETGGQNAMIVDSTAMPEQVSDDVIQSAFGSCGQRCSSLRVLYLQEEIADEMIDMIKGAMAEITVGSPAYLQTDVGPVIDANALTMLKAHYQRMHQEASLIYQVPLSDKCQRGNYFAPCAFLIESITQLPNEIFGPILHVIRYKAENIDQIIDDINSTGYGLTLGIHSRIDKFSQYIQQRVHVGNTYVNRNMIGAVVGVQPFGGEGLSGTGPKAGGPNYLRRLCTERSVCIDTTASGGNASLLTLA